MKANKQEVFTKALVLSFGKSGLSLSVPEFELVDFKLNFRDMDQIRDVKLDEEKNKKKLIIKFSNQKKKKMERKKHRYYEIEEEEEDDDANEDVFLRKIEFQVYSYINYSYFTEIM